MNDLKLPYEEQINEKIKFRGKRLNNGEWAYGAFVPTN